MARFTGKVVVITGAASGIGEGTARRFAAEGAKLVLGDLDETPLKHLAANLGTEIAYARTDVAQLAECEALVDLALQRFDAVDVLVNNAGVYPGGPTESLDDDTVDALLATNIRAPHVLVAALAPGMAERGSGHIVNIGSWMARVGVPFMALYPATKAAVEQLTRAWAAEYGHRGIRVVTVAPGATATPGNADSADVLAAMTQGTPAGVPVQPVDIARAVRWVVSDQAAFVTGGTIDVDGGIASTRLG